MDSKASGQDEAISQFCSMTGTTASEAHDYLDANGWDVEAAVTEYFAEQDEESHHASGQEGGGASTTAPRSSLAMDMSSSTGASSSSTPRLSSSTAARPSTVPKKFATLGDFSSGADDADSTDDEDRPQNLFAGGEKSGLAVQNPDSIRQKIIEKAKKAQSTISREGEPRKSHFTGTARTLGGDDTPSRVIESSSSSSSARMPSPAPRVQRTLHFWADGFSVDDGDLYRSDEPRNAEILEGIRQGRAPLYIMNVLPGQEVDVEIKQHDEKYVKPKPKYKPFSGHGQRLGSPTPSVRSSAPGSPSTAAAAAAAVAEAGPEPAKPTIDESQPVVTLQIRLGDGTRLASRFNLTHTIGDVYDFISAASPASQSRAWVLMTTFPSKELTEKGTALGELAEFKRGGVVVQKWV